ncbi:MAG: glycosyltransferase 87 family protein [Candidatus Nanopelagicales bacterium]
MSGPRSRVAAADWLVWTGTRLFLLLIIAGVMPWPEQIRDLDTYQRWVDEALRFGHYPSDPMWQYPPLAGPVFRLGALLPGERLGFAALFLLADATIMLLLTRAADRRGVDEGLSERADGRRLWAWTPLLTGPLLLARFDVIPTAFAVAALLWAAQPVLSGGLATVGAWLKVWPALVVLGLPRRALPRGLVGALATSAAIVSTLWMTTTDPLSFLSQQASRGIQIESVWAWPYLLAKLGGAPVQIVYRYGAHEVQAPGVAVVATVAALSSLLALVGCLGWRLSGRWEGEQPADVALLVVLLSVVTSRVFSGQYFIWLIGLAAVCLSGTYSAPPVTRACPRVESTAVDDRELVRAGPGRMRRPIGWLIAAALATQLVYPWLYSALLEGSPLAVLVQSVRIVAILTSTGLAMRALGSTHHANS